MNDSVIGIGHDLQLSDELGARPSLLEPGVMFTELELGAALAHGDGAERSRALATLFSAKEAFFKALPAQSGWLWSELELARDEQGRPYFHYSGALGTLMLRERWSALVSVSHSGAYVSSFVLLLAHRG